MIWSYPSLMQHARIISIRIILVSILALQFATVSYTNCQSDLTGNSCLIEIPEIHELVFVVYALATLEDTSSNTIQRESDYYKEVIQTFGSFRNEKAVKKLAGAMRSGYDPLRMDACLYSLNDQNEIRKSKTINNLSWGNKNTLRKFLPALEAFALKSNFKKFYNDHLAYYKSQIDLLRIQGQPESQWRWLTQKFNVDYASVTIVFSPLSYAQHSTNRIKDGHIEHIYIFVSGPFQFEDKIKTEQVQPQICRMLFTELDHNFVNPLSEKYKEKIEVVFRYTRNFGDIKKHLDIPNHWQCSTNT